MAAGDREHAAPRSPSRPGDDQQAAAGCADQAARRPVAGGRGDAQERPRRFCAAARAGPAAFEQGEPERAAARRGGRVDVTGGALRAAAVRSRRACASGRRARRRRARPHRGRRSDAAPAGRARRAGGNRPRRQHAPDGLPAPGDASPVDAGGRRAREVGAEAVEVGLRGGGQRARGVRCRSPPSGREYRVDAREHEHLLPGRRRYRHSPGRADRESPAAAARAPGARGARRRLDAQRAASGRPERRGPGSSGSSM